MKWYFKVLQNYANFNGRARRKEYWMFFLFNVLISIIINVIDASAGNATVGTIYSLAMLVPGIAVGVRRMHDVGKSGWYLLIPIYNLILAVSEGTAGENEYGLDPKSDGPTFDFEKGAE